MNPRILLAEPNAAFRSIYTHVLESEGYRVHVVGDVTSLFSRMQTSTFDLLVLDPMIFGAQALPLLRKLLNHVPCSRVLIFTSISQPQWLELSSEMGTCDYLLKGKTSPNLLVSRLDEIVTWLSHEENATTRERDNRLPA